MPMLRFHSLLIIVVLSTGSLSVVSADDDLGSKNFRPPGRVLLRAQSPFDDTEFEQGFVDNRIETSENTALDESFIVEHVNCGCPDCLGTDEDNQSFFGRLKIKSRKFRQKMYFGSRKKNRKLLFPICAPLCSPNFGYHPTRWRPFPPLVCEYPPATSTDTTPLPAASFLTPIDDFNQ
jgi:hypothetical protein